MPRVFENVEISLYPAPRIARCIEVHASDCGPACAISYATVPPMIVSTDIAVFDVAQWEPDEEYPYFPEGSRDKRLLRCPANVTHSALIPRHRYLFKKSRAVYPEQFWGEVVAYHVGRLCGVPVPPAFPAWNSQTGECAALVEWFYGYPGQPTESFLSGGLFMKALIKDYDLKRGRQHNFASIELLCQVLANSPKGGRPQLGQDWPQAWARMLTFDALIGNTDRHHENWGFKVTRLTDPKQATFSLAPAFDNGTSLGHEWSPDQFGRFVDVNHLNRYVRKGHHHMRWKAGDASPAGHAELLLQLVEKHPDSQAAMEAVLAFDAAQLHRSFAALSTLPMPIMLSHERAEHMLRLILARREYLRSALTSP